MITRLEVDDLHLLQRISQGGSVERDRRLTSLTQRGFLIQDSNGIVRIFSSYFGELLKELPIPPEKPEIKSSSWQAVYRFGGTILEKVAEKAIEIAAKHYFGV